MKLRHYCVALILALTAYVAHAKETIPETGPIKNSKIDSPLSKKLEDSAAKIEVLRRAYNAVYKMSFKKKEMKPKLLNALEMLQKPFCQKECTGTGKHPTCAIKAFGEICTKYCIDGALIEPCQKAYDRALSNVSSKSEEDQPKSSSKKDSIKSSKKKSAKKAQSEEEEDDTPKDDEDTKTEDDTKDEESTDSESDDSGDEE